MIEAPRRELKHSDAKRQRDHRDSRAAEGIDLEADPAPMLDAYLFTAPTRPVTCAMSGGWGPDIIQTIDVMIANNTISGVRWATIGLRGKEFPANPIGRAALFGSLLAKGHRQSAESIHVAFDDFLDFTSISCTFCILPPPFTGIYSENPLKRTLGLRGTFHPLSALYCLAIPARSITPAHLAMSAISLCFNSSGELALASMPSSAYCSLTSGIATISRTTPLRTLMISAAVLGCWPFSARPQRMLLTLPTGYV